eukprot:m.485050 g.485050  ORF g.485050 m.485050 type:complete len:808 (-) comp23643_c0_seq1:142-2565(-)
MLRLIAVFAVVAAVSAAKWPIRQRAGVDGPTTTTESVSDEGVPASFDCGMRKLAYAYGQHLLPRHGSFESLFYALGLNDDCNGTLVTPRVNVADDGKTKPRASGVFVCAELGNDENPGTETRPVRSLQLAIDLAAKRTGKDRLVVLRGGTHFIKDTIMITAAHSNMDIISYPGEKAVVSGGVEIKADWKPYKVSSTSNIYVTDVTEVDDVPGLQVDGFRATRARYPNLPGGIEVSPGYGYMVPANQGKWTPPQFDKFGPVKYFTDTAHTRNDTAAGWFQHYMIGISGLCSVYTPPVSYWCSEHPSGGGAFAFRTPSGVTPAPNALPNLPYTDPSSAIFFVWRPARWANWMFEVGKVDTKSWNFTFGYGGFQGARGNNEGGDWFVENVFEELDSPGEFFFDKTDKKLYFYYNGTGAPPASAVVVAPQKQVLVNMSGTQWAPVTDVKLQDVTYTASSYTYMNPHGVPSAGDWALERFSAVFLEGTEGVVIDGCNFTRLDGNAVMVSGYNRNATIQNSDFEFIGGNAVAAWGYTNETEGEGHPQAGVDGTDGNHPRYTNVISNMVREVGLYEKQSSFFVQAKTAQSYISGNVFFNGPRAGINANDGFGGGDEISHNLVFSTCRESGDHGPFNSWDRQPFITTVNDGTPSLRMAWRHIHHNFLIDNYSPQEGVDNDDGSAYYKTHDNFLVYGGQGMKNDFGGHDNYHQNNIYAYVGRAIGFYDAPMIEGHADEFSGNRVVMTGTDVGSLNCAPPGKTILANNSYYTPTGQATECKKPFAEWQKAGNEPGSSVAAIPSDATILGWAKEKLGF